MFEKKGQQKNANTSNEFNPSHAIFMCLACMMGCPVLVFPCKMTEHPIEWLCWMFAFCTTTLMISSFRRKSMEFERLDFDWRIRFWPNRGGKLLKIAHPIIWMAKLFGRFLVEWGGESSLILFRGGPWPVLSRVTLFTRWWAQFQMLPRIDVSLMSIVKSLLQRFTQSRKLKALFLPAPTMASNWFISQNYRYTRRILTQYNRQWISVPFSVHNHRSGKDATRIERDRNRKTRNRDRQSTAKHARRRKKNREKERKERTTTTTTTKNVICHWTEYEIHFAYRPANVMQIWIFIIKQVIYCILFDVIVICHRHVYNGAHCVRMSVAKAMSWFLPFARERSTTLETKQRDHTVTHRHTGKYLERFNECAQCRPANSGSSQANGTFKRKSLAQSIPNSMRFFLLLLLASFFRPQLWIWCHVAQ